MSYLLWIISISATIPLLSDNLPIAQNKNGDRVCVSYRRICFRGRFARGDGVEVGNTADTVANKEWDLWAGVRLALAALHSATNGRQAPGPIRLPGRPLNDAVTLGYSRSLVFVNLQRFYFLFLFYLARSDLNKLSMGWSG